MHDSAPPPLLRKFKSNLATVWYARSSLVPGIQDGEHDRKVRSRHDLASLLSLAGTYLSFIRFALFGPKANFSKNGIASLILF